MKLIMSSEFMKKRKCFHIRLTTANFFILIKSSCKLEIDLKKKKKYL